MLEVHGKYFNVHDDEFVTAFHKYVDTDMPLFSLKADILYMMYLHKIDYFKVPGRYTRNNKTAIFEFDVATHEKNMTFEVYTFKGVKFYNES